MLVLQDTPRERGAMIFLSFDRKLWHTSKKKHKGSTRQNSERATSLDEKYSAQEAGLQKDD